jgi:Prolipoprotein diacylglyceryl transferase
LFLIWIARQYAERVKPGAIFGGWLVLAGVGRVIIEFFRPDQPRIPGTEITYSALVAALMAIAGVIFLLIRYGRLKVAFAEGWEDEYQISAPEEEPRTRRTRKTEMEAEANEEEPGSPQRRNARKSKAKTVSSK